jgi:RNA polymerase sigma factor (sigma-70 family)
MSHEGTLMKKSTVRKPRAKDGNSGDEATRLWAAYRKRRTRTNRDRIVEHFMPWARRAAIGLARALGCDDPDNAAGEALLVFSTRAVPLWDGRGDFCGYATCLMRNRVIDALRRQRPVSFSIDQGTEDADGDDCLRSVLAAAVRSEGDPCFCQLLAGLGIETATVLWLHWCCKLSLRAVGEVLGLSEWKIKVAKQEGLAELGNRLGASD